MLSHNISLKKSAGRFLTLVLILVIIVIINYYFKLDFEMMRTFLDRFSLREALIIYIIIYILTNILFPLAKDILKFIGAIYLGAILSSLGIWLAEIVNAIILFQLAHYFGRDFVKEKLRGRAKTIDERIGASGFKGILVLRLVPLLPYRVLDLMVGLSAFGFLQYLVIVIIGSPLRIFWIQYILAGVGVGVLNKPEALLNYLMDNKIAFVWSLIYLVLVIVVGLRLKIKKRI